MALSAIAKQSNLNTVALMRYLKESGVPLLSIPLPEKGSRHALFLHKAVAARIQIPSRNMLIEGAQRRIAAAQKQRWAEHRRAKEMALGRPLRRVRMDRRPPELYLRQIDQNHIGVFT